VVWAMAGLGCSPGPAPKLGVARGAAAAPSAAAETPAPAPRAPPSESSAAHVTQVAVLEPEQLRALEGRGFAFAPLAVEQEATSAAELRKLPALRGLFATLEADVRAAARPYPLARVTSSDGFRLFDARWLGSSEMRFELSGVFNRLDRRPFYPQSCGEVLFVYRLAYRTTQGAQSFSSRLPMTLNLVFLIDARGDERCAAAARAWQSPAGLSGSELVDWLIASGALSSAQRARWRLKSIESNLQTFRLQSSVLPSLAGHIEYDLRVFHPKDAARSDFAPAAMENMPDVTALRRDRSLAQALRDELRRPETLGELDRGTLRLPERYLARQARSFAPRGLERRGNRPFSQLFRGEDFADLSLSSYETIRSPAALLRRLDAASCSGCHQSRSIAGFHHVGRDDAQAPIFNALLSGSSSHLTADLERRRRYVEQLAAGRAPDERRPLPELQGGGAGLGAPCGLGDPGFAAWQCENGYACSKLEDPDVGVCLSQGALGQPCEYGSVLPGSAPQRDRALLTKHECGQAASCTSNFSGFPQGACTASCKTESSGSACADYLDVDGFQKCLRGQATFEACAKDFVFGARVQACDEQSPCRQDYVCVRTRGGHGGACLPPYFVYQLRLDGYPLKY
jgi:hypothetical protein